MAKEYFESKNIKVFPCAYRGQYTVEGNKSLFDPESRLNTEFNFLHTTDRSRPSYIISFVQTNTATVESKKEFTLTCVVGGYYFEIYNCKYEDFITKINNEDKIQNLYIRKARTLIRDSAAQTIEIDRYTYILKSWKKEEDATADSILDYNNNFVGLKLSATEPALSEGSLDTQFCLQVFNEIIIEGETKSLKLNYNNFLPKIDAGNNTNNNAIILGGRNLTQWKFANENAGDKYHNKNFMTNADGNYATSIGGYSYAKGNKSLAIGENTIAVGDSSFVSGYNTIALKEYAEASGHQTVANGKYSHAEGYSTTTSNEYAHSEGICTVAGGWGAHAEGSYTEASAKYAHVEGDHSVASANYSHAEGYYTIAKHEAAHTSGNNTISSRAYQTVIGEYNADNSNALFIIGNGHKKTGEETEDTRTNILTATQNKININKPLYVLDTITIGNEERSSVLGTSGKGLVVSTPVGRNWNIELTNIAGTGNGASICYNAFDKASDKGSWVVGQGCGSGEEKFTWYWKNNGAQSTCPDGNKLTLDKDGTVLAVGNLKSKTGLNINTDKFTVDSSGVVTAASTLTAGGLITANAGLTVAANTDFILAGQKASEFALKIDLDGKVTKNDLALKASDITTESNKVTKFVKAISQTSAGKVSYTTDYFTIEDGGQGAIKLNGSAIINITNLGITGTPTFTSVTATKCVKAGSYLQTSVKTTSDNCGIVFANNDTEKARIIYDDSEECFKFLFS